MLKAEIHSIVWNAYKKFDGKVIPNNCSIIEGWMWNELDFNAEKMNDDKSISADWKNIFKKTKGIERMRSSDNELGFWNTGRQVLTEQIYFANGKANNKTNECIYKRMRKFTKWLFSSCACILFFLLIFTMLNINMNNHGMHTKWAEKMATEKCSFRFFFIVSFMREIKTKEVMCLCYFHALKTMGGLCVGLTVSQFLSQ